MSASNHTYSILPFVPAKDFEASTAFYTALGFPGVRTTPLALQDWGPLLGHIWDPNGVLWHLTQVPLADE